MRKLVRTVAASFQARRQTRRWPPATRSVPSAERALRRQVENPWIRRHAAVQFVAFVLSLLGFQGESPAATAPAARQPTAALLLRADGHDEPITAIRVHTDVRMQVSGVIARVELMQRFDNPSAEWLEGEYVFPLPENGAVDTLRIDVGGRVTVGTVQEKQHAVASYRQAADRGQQAGLVEQRRPNLFRARVANIGPGERIEITVGYLQLVDQHAGEYRVRVPFAITPRYEAGGDPAVHGATVRASVAAEDAGINPTFARPDAQLHTAALEVMLDAGAAVEDLRSHFHAISTLDLGGRYRIMLDDGLAAPDRDFELSWRPLIGSDAAPAIFLEPFQGMTHALLVVMPPQTRTTRSGPRELVFVIDTSGSMEGESLEQAKAALLHGLASLDHRDTFNIIQFASQTELLHLRSAPATARNQRDAAEYVLALRADGGTEMIPALEAAFQLPTMRDALRQIVFITDGAVGNEKALFELIERRSGDARLFTVGIGAAPNGHLMRMAARAGRGSHTFIGSTEQVADRMAELIERIERPVVTDIRIDWPRGTTAELAPAIVPDLYAGEPIVVAARLLGTPQGVVTVSGTEAGEAWVRQIPLRTHGFSNAGVARAWARSRIEELQGLERTGLASGDLRSAIVELALQYQLTTPYTSLIAVAPEPGRPQHATMKPTPIAATLPHGMSGDLVLSSLPRAATRAPLHLIAGMLALLLAALSVAVARREPA